MRKFLVAATMLAALSTHAMAQGSDAFNRPALVETAGVAEKIAQRYAEMQGWCSMKAPEPKPWQTVIYYARDAQGVCTPRVKAGR